MALVVHGVTKSYGATRALGGVDLEAARGQVTAVIGQNGAGKSTLMGVLAGAVSPDSGTLTLDGTPYKPRNPLEARLAGVAMVHQELSLCPHLSVAENVFLGALPERRGLVDWRETRRRAQAALEPFADEGDIDVRAKVSDLSLANQQIVEIARALATHACRVLILDEPTSSLAASDTERLFSRLRDIKKNLVVLYLSHFLEEVKAVADRFVVMRDGKDVGAGDVAATSIDAMVELMAGREIGNLYPRTPRSPGAVVLSLELPGSSKLELRRGEVVGIAGLLGAGRTSLLRAIFGLNPPRAGTLRVKDLSGWRSPHARLAQGVALLSEDRKAEGLALALSIATNVTLSRPGRLLVTRRRDERATEPWMRALGVRARGPEQPVSELSGGNQQKVALARLFHHGADVLLLDEPTRGIDVEAKVQIYELIDRAASEGKALLVVSSYLSELVGVCDRVHVMKRGALGPPHDARVMDEHALLREAAL